MGWDVQSLLGQAKLRQLRVGHEALEAIRRGDHALYRKKAIEQERIAIECRTASPDKT
jgi:hypothetical protein